VTLNRLSLATSVLVAGFVAAWPFRLPRPNFATTVAAAGGPSDVSLRSQEVRLEVSPLAESSPAVGLEQLSLKIRKARDRPPAEEKPVPAALETLGSPPPLGQMYESLLQPGGLPPESGKSPYMANTSKDAFAASLRALSVSAQSVDDRGGTDGFRPVLKQHRIVDGDTLDGLAQRYLGDAHRAEEIFELNRDQLRDPNILPVGRRLRIPHRSESSLTPVARSN
jgi:nucleoid-associated protein YgaU